MELGHGVNYTLERVFGVQNFKVWAIFFYYFLSLDNCLEKIPINLFDYPSNYFNFQSKRS